MFNLPYRTLAIISLFIAASIYSYRLYLRYLKQPKRQNSQHLQSNNDSSDEDLKLWQPRKDSNASSSLYFTESDNEYMHSNYEEIEPRNVEYQSLV